MGWNVICNHHFKSDKKSWDFKKNKDHADTNSIYQVDICAITQKNLKTQNSSSTIDHRMVSYVPTTNSSSTIVPSSIMQRRPYLFIFCLCFITSVTGKLHLQLAQYFSTLVISKLVFARSAHRCIVERWPILAS